MERYVCKQNKCTGCMACRDACRHDAITVVDSVKYYNAVIDTDKCVNCGMCRKVCQQLSAPKMMDPVGWMQGWSVNDDVRNHSSSGGLASEIEKCFIEKGGVVYSCVFRNGRFEFEIAEKPEDVKKFRGSKYVKSDPSGVYKKIVELTETGKKVLFVGLPCQVAALKKYTDSVNLYTIDIICHGSPSPYVLRSFLNSQGTDITDVKTISFRNNNKFMVTADGRSFSAPSVRDYYTVSFIDALTYTENCYECRYARINRVSDLTLGDAWGSELPKEVRRKGVSVALYQTEKGEELLENENLELLPVDLEKIIKINSQLDHPSLMPKEREAFLNAVINGLRYDSIFRRLFPGLYYKNLIKTLII